MNKIRAIAVELGSRDSFQDLEFRLKQQWKSYCTVQLANSYHFQNPSKWF